MSIAVLSSLLVQTLVAPPSGRFAHRWEVLQDGRVREEILRKHFHVRDESRHGEVFLIEGVPAACLFFSSGAEDCPRVHSFHFNRELVLMFDAGPGMRRSIYRRYRNIDVSLAKGVDFFLNA